MRKLACFALILVAFAVLAPVATAHETGVRDPFEPVISPEELTGDDTISTTTDTSDGVEPVTTTDATEDQLASTGFDVTTWLALAYVLLAAGATLLAMVRFSPRYR